ncbi:MAG: hypothetical protein HY831_00090 [Candidatus Aenigmarchaeota archaeon]|nr:hypothetical protein [Candidatus Aenigmarchaeota archaeon]
MKLRVGVDLDCVLRDFKKSLFNVYKQKYPTHQIVPSEQWTNYWLGGYFPIGEEVYKFFREDAAEEIFLNANLIQGAYHMMLQLNKIAHVTIVSFQPNEKIKELSIRWLENKGIQFHDILFTIDKEYYVGDFFLDDCEEHLNFIETAGNSTPICWNDTWNQNWKGIRVNNHQEFLNLVKSKCG